MDKKLIGLIILVVFAVVVVSGCIGDEEDPVNITEDNQTKNDTNQTKDTSSGKSSPTKSNKKPDPEPNVEPEPPADEPLT
jgi:hypothetical protein